MSVSVEFFYDVASPYSYLAAHRLWTMQNKEELDIRWQPMLLGGVFRATENTMPAAVPARARYLLTDLIRWAKREEIPFLYSSSFPHNSLTAMRVLCAADTSDLVEVSMAIFRAAWVDDQNISDVDVLKDILGSRWGHLLEKAQEATVKDKLKELTAKAIAYGAFGAPAFVVNSELYWGNDRLDMALEHARLIS